MSPLEHQLAVCVFSGMTQITADDITNCGNITIDASHAPNGKQSAIGSFFRQMNADGILRPTGNVVKSKAPKRKGGMIQVWEITHKGRMLYGDTAGSTSDARRRRRRVVHRPVPVEEVPVHDGRRLVRRRPSGA